MYSLLTYGGLQSADEEVVFRTGEALANSGHFAVSDSAGTPRFGTAVGVDGKHYSVFGPGQSLAIVPWIKIAQWINQTQWYVQMPQMVPCSVYASNNSLQMFRMYYSVWQSPKPLEPHALRFLVSFNNVFIGALCVVVFFLLVRLLTQSETAACYVTLLFAFGSLLVPYTSTLFSEVLATFLVLLALYSLVWHACVLATAAPPTGRHTITLFASGVALGAATATHITAILFLPFFFAYAVFPYYNRRLYNGMWWAGIVWLVGIGLVLLLLGYYNFTRFDNAWETGRTVDAQLQKMYEYGVFVPPWNGLWALLFSTNKGIVWHCPAVIAGIFLCRPFYRRYPFLTKMLFAAALFRLLFIASRSDWHGGFCPGPRYLVMFVPLLLLPLGEVVAGWLRNNKAAALWKFRVFTILCVMATMYGALCATFLHYYTMKYLSKQIGLGILSGTEIYTSWQTFILPQGMRLPLNPWILRIAPCDNYLVVACTAILSTAALLFVYLRVLPSRMPSPAFCVEPVCKKTAGNRKSD